MRYVQNTIAARREVRSIPVVLTSRTTQRRRVRSRREEQVPLACQWMRPRSEMQRTAKARSIAHLCGRIPKGPLLRAPVRGVTRRDGGCDSVREAPVREQPHKPRHKAVNTASAPLPAPLFESPSPGHEFSLQALLLASCLDRPNGVARAYPEAKIVAIARAVQKPRNS